MGRSDRLTNQQLGSLNGADVYLQWNGIQHNRGLVLVHNIILIQGVGAETGPITLSNIRFPYRIPTLAPLEVVTTPSATSASAQPQAESATTQPRVASAKAHSRVASTKDSPRGAELLNATNNSGIISHAQYNDHGFGDRCKGHRRVRLAAERCDRWQRIGRRDTLY
jgi:hypothetical protein